MGSYGRFQRLYLLKYWSHRLVEHIGRKLRLQRICLCTQKVTSSGNPNFLKMRRCSFWNLGFPVEVTFWVHRHILWSLSFRPMCSTSLCDQYFRRYRRPNISKWTENTHKIHVKIELFSLSSNISAICWAILLWARSKKFPKILVSELVLQIPIALQCRKLFTKQSVYFNLAHPVQNAVEERNILGNKPQIRRLRLVQE